VYYRRVGDVPRKRHVVHRDDSGHRYAEELVGAEGFSDESSLLYHRSSPSALLEVAAVEDCRPLLEPNHPVSPLHLRTNDLPVEGDPVLGRHLLLGNDDVRVCVIASAESSGLYRDAVGDELVFVRDGHAVLESSFGTLAVAAGDYVVVPSGVTHRWVVDGEVPLAALVLECTGHVRPPRKYLSTSGQFLEGSPYCERDVRAPDAPLVADDGDAGVVVRTRAGLSRHQYAHHPFDVGGWDGCLYPWALSIHDFEPIVGSLHQPPPVHLTFEGPNFVVCSFVPRPFDFHPDAVKIPYHHSNVDSDEVIFYSAGDFMSRAGSGIDVGSITLHPPGFVHGPQPGSYERSVDATRTDELAVMLDTFHSLQVTEVAMACSDPAYLQSWSR
jgi:homogentisate 1,2-dioxygenase